MTIDTLKPVLDHIGARDDEYVARLMDYVKNPSISAHNIGIREVSELLVAQLGALGMSVESIPTKGHPFVLAEYRVDPAKPTVLLYGHYDVQPPDPLELWDSPLLSVGPQSFIYEIVYLAGGVNVIRKNISPHPQVEIEGLLQANPELILKLHYRPSVISRYPSLRELKVFQENRVFTPRNMDWYLRPGPRLFLAVEELQKTLKSLKPAKP